MEIIKTDLENLSENKKMIYKLTKASGKSVKDVEGTFEVQCYLLYEDENNKGEIQQVLSILTVDGDKLQTISQTFIRDFLDIAEIMAGDPYSIIIIHGKTKAGRDFVTCELEC